jgi:hypothetical protein
MILFDFDWIRWVMWLFEAIKSTIDHPQEEGTRFPTLAYDKH